MLKIFLKLIKIKFFGLILFSIIAFTSSLFIFLLIQNELNFELNSTKMMALAFLYEPFIIIFIVLASLKIGKLME
jgi:hypothetical protein